MKNNKIYKVITFILIPILIFGGFYLYRTIDEFRNIKKSYNYDKYLSIWRLRGYVVSMDDYLAKTLVSIDSDSRFNALLSSLEYSSIISKSMDNVTLMGRSYNPIFNDSNMYLDYLVKKNQPLTTIERENIKLIRKHLDIVIPAYNEAITIIEEKELNKSYNHDEDIVLIMDNMMDNLKKLPNIGEDDESFKKFKNNYTGYYPRNLFKDEKEYTDKELSKIAKKFMGKLWEGLIGSKSGAGSNPEFSEYVRFVGTKNKKLVGSYKVEISRLGGHIMRFEAMDDFENPSDFAQEDDKTLGPMTNKEAIEYGKELIKRWDEEDLELYDTKKVSNKLYLTFVPFKDKIPLVNRSVDIVINTDIGKPLKLDAHDYFINYNRKPPLEAKLSKEEIIDMLNDELKVDGDLSLEVIRGKSSSDVLVYKVPIKGVENIKYIYLNAITGKDEGVKRENKY